MSSWRTSVVNPLPSEVLLEMTGGLLARDACNAFGLMAPSKRGEERKVRGYAIFEQASMFSHDCLPNACRFEYLDRDGDGNTDVIVRALHEIVEGSEVCLSYFPVDYPYADRQERLQEEYGFWCKCGRCNVESEWKDEDEDDEGDSDEELEFGAGDVGAGKSKLDDAESGDDDDDFGHAMFFMKYLCPVEKCGGTIAPLPPGDLDAQGLEGSMECNFCGHVGRTRSSMAISRSTLWTTTELELGISQNLFSGNPFGTDGMQVRESLCNSFL